jgi:chromosome segregation ATPase
MAGARSNTTRIENLEDKASNMSSRLEVHDVLIEKMNEALSRWTEAAEGHSSKITIIEQTLVLVDLKKVQTAIADLEKDSVALRKDLEVLQKWKDELKKEKEETTRRWWSFGPNITAALIAGTVTLLGVGLNYWLNHSR